MNVKLNKFNDLSTAVKKFGVTEEIKTEIKQFKKEGLNIHISDVLSTNNEELIIVLKDGSIRKTIVHIVDISSWPTNWGHPRFHIYNCEKIQEMRNKGKNHRYKASSRKTGKFFLIKKDKEWDESLAICSFCLNKYNQQYSQQWIKNNFPLKKYIEAPIKHSGFSDMQSDYCAIPNAYTNSWPEISKKIKDLKKWYCSVCGKDFSRKECKQFLHTHHIDANKRNKYFGKFKSLMY